MNIGLIVDPKHNCRWHKWLSDDLVNAGHDVQICLSSKPSRWPTGLQSALHIDRLLHRIGGEHALDRARSVDLGPVACAAAPHDLVINCSGTPHIGCGVPSLTMLFDDEASEIGAISAFLDGRQIDIRIVDETNHHVLASATPAIDSRASITWALDCVLSRAIELMVDVVARCSTADGCKVATVPATSSRGVVTPLHHTTVPSRAYQSLSRTVSRKFAKLLLPRQSRDRRWAIAIRPCRDQGLIAGAWPNEAEFRIVPDDGKRFFADPILLDHEGRTWLFCEEFPYATRRGVISVAEVGADGSVGPMRPVLERPYHLSYPFVFEDGGKFWMIPESASNKTVDLYVATDFPHSWRFVRHLLEGVAAHDTTLMRHDGRYILFTTTLHRKSTSWDNLSVYEADSLDGPFTQRSSGSLLINARQSRSAGAILERRGELIRPAQDCSERYGGAISLNRIDCSRLPILQQTEVGTIAVTSPSHLTGPHTYSRSAKFEAVDVNGAIDQFSTITLSIRPRTNQSGILASEPDVEHSSAMHG